jgi:glycosyltransferase involved in cell wall biosynthesis
MGLRVLLTNFAIATRSGSELYVWDLANGLLARGHDPVVYAPTLGRLADELRTATIPVVADLRQVSAAPDLIHGHHNHELMTALLHFPGVPAVRVCHGWSDEPIQRFPRILRYVAVDHTVRDRMVSEWGVPADRVRVMLNFVDTDRFLPRGPLPERPARALVFNNDAAQHLHLVRRACAQLGVTVDAAGASVGRVADAPERMLGQYDLVFAKARCAIEAMAAGTAVVVCDQAGMGPLVTSTNMEDLRRLNFGVRALREPVSVESLVREISRYDAADAALVSRRIRATARMDLSLERWIEMYNEVIAEQRASPLGDQGVELRVAAEYLRSMRPNGRGEPAYRFLRDLYFSCERSTPFRALLPSRSVARRIAARLRSL